MPSYCGLTPHACRQPPHRPCSSPTVTSVFQSVHVSQNPHSLAPSLADEPLQYPCRRRPPITSITSSELSNTRAIPLSSSYSLKLVRAGLSPFVLSSRSWRGTHGGQYTLASRQGNTLPLSDRCGACLSAIFTHDFTFVVLVRTPADRSSLSQAATRLPPAVHLRAPCFYPYPTLFGVSSRHLSYIRISTDSTSPPIPRRLFTVHTCPSWPLTDVWDALSPSTLTLRQ